ncbi:thioesterase family protein [Nocardia zapadnayensis]|uniref:PaaI family thioesterase n=1 Tax=Nocardia rhamnosiphila TaxID=426716 RepID=UPI00224838FD|nr:acyl-CoA thioesterase domain-containing protein [Nocardia zapadnayensis]MCX0272802.1 thioesterase family protein [Nocardia zapadnayensis]
MITQWWTALPPVPALTRLGIRSAPTADGRVETALDFGTLWKGAGVAGLAALLCDAATGLAVGTLEPDRALSTAMLGVQVTGHPHPAGQIRAVAAPAARRGDYVLATASVLDDLDTEFARATSWWAVRGPRGAQPTGTPTGPGPAPPVSSGPDTCPADPTRTPFGRALGLTGFRRDLDGTSFELADPTPFHNRSATLHGGLGALLAELAAVAAVDDGVRTPEVLSLNCHYLRAAGPGPEPVRVRGHRVRSGRTSGVARGEVAAPDGRPAVLADVTVAFLASTDGRKR